MTQKQFIAIVMLSSLVACSSDHADDDVRSGAISFVVRENVTRAVEPIDSTYQLYVSALWHTDKTAHYGNTPVQQLTQPTTTDPYWDSGWIWPPTGTMDFIAWGGSKEIDEGCASFKYTGGLTELESATPTTTFKTVTLDFTPADYQLKGDNDILYLNKLDEAKCQGQKNPRSLVFNHAMACVAIGIAAGDTTTAEFFALRNTKIDELVTSGRLYMEVDQTPDQQNQKSISAQWDEADSLRVKSKDITLAALSHKEGETTRPLVKPDAKGPVFLTQPVFVLPSQGDQAKLTINYSINGSSLSFSFPFANFWKNKPEPHTWEQGSRYAYNFTVTLKEIVVGAEEEQWQTEIGGTAYEPEWDVEISTGALEATWGVEIGGEAYEVHWTVEIGVSALEAIWVVEMGSSASESGWNSEIGSNAGENGWNTETGANANEGEWNSETGATADEEDWNNETGGSASEENWIEETGGSAFEAPWHPGEDIYIDGNSGS